MTHARDGDEAVTRVDVHRALHIHRKTGLAFAQLSIDLNDDETLHDLKAVTIWPNGKRFPVSAEAIDEMVRFEIARPGGRTIRRKTLAFPRARPGAVLEYRYTTIESGWSMAYRHQLDTTLPTRKALFEVAVTEKGVAGKPNRVKVKLGSTARRFTGPTSERLSSEEQRLHVWEAENVPARRSVVFGLPVRRTAPTVSYTVVKVSSGDEERTIYSDWSEVAQPLWERAIDSGADPPEVLVRAQPKGGPRAKVTAAWRRVQSMFDNRTPIAADGPFRDAAETVESRIANGDDRALMLFSLLRAWGLAPAIVVVPPKHVDDILAWLPTPAH